MILNYKKLDLNAKEPFKKHINDAGFDLTAIWKKETDKYIEFGTGLAFQIPEGYVGLLFPRSSITNMDLMVKNSIGLIDSGYLGEIKFRFIKAHNDLFAEGNTEPDENGKTNDWLNSLNSQFRKPDYYEVGDRVGQIVFLQLPTIKLNEVKSLIDTDRGTDGYGSSGK